MKKSKQHRDELIESVSEEMKKSRNENADDFLVASNFNQVINRKQIEAFIQENRLFEIHSYVNNCDLKNIDNTRIKGSKQIDAAMTTTELLEVVQGSRLINFKEITDLDHRGFIINIHRKE